MTKPRDPTSIDEALAKIAGQVPGAWKAMAAHVGYDANTVRKWGDEDDETKDIKLKVAIKLDILFQSHGGEGRPLYDCYGHLIGAAFAHRFADNFDMIRRAADLAREMGEAVEALLIASLPGADHADRHTAKKELLDAFRKIQAILHAMDAPVPEERAQAPP